MTVKQDERAWVCVALHELTKDEPLAAMPRGPSIRSFTSGPLTMTATEMDGETVLDAWLQGIGKVASFRVDPSRMAFETVAFKRKTLPQWVPILEFETNARPGT